MDVLHLHWLTPTRQRSSTGLFVWAETAAAPQPSRDRRKKSVQLHPFASVAEQLHNLLAALGWRYPSAQESLTLWLPTNGYGPCPSPDLVHEWETGEASHDLLRWQVTGLRLDAAQSLSLLAHLHRYDLPPGSRLGADGRFWQIAYTLVLELLARQLYRPTLAEARGTGTTP